MIVTFAVAAMLAQPLQVASNPLARPTGPAVVAVTLREWKIEVPAQPIGAGEVTFVVRNLGTIPHAFEVEGRGVEKETAVIPPGDSARLTVRLRAGRYELYCPVGGDSHKHLGMVTHVTVGGTRRGSGADGATAVGVQAAESPREVVKGIHVVGAGPVIQLLPGPFPFADSAAAVIKARPDDQRADLTHKAEQGPYSNNVARVSGSFTVDAWDHGAAGDTVHGVAEFTTADGVKWSLAMDRVQTRDIPFNPRFGGVIMGLYYHGATHVHTPLVPTIRSAVALWGIARLMRNGVEVPSDVFVHVMLLSRTRKPPEFALACWDCSRNPIEELQLQITPAPGTPPLEAPGGVLFINWQRSTGVPIKTR